MKFQKIRKVQHRWSYIGLLLTLCCACTLIILQLSLKETKTIQSRATDSISDSPVTKTVHLLIFNPTIEQNNAEKLTSVRNWNDPNILTDEIIHDISLVSHGFVNYTIQSRETIDGYFKKRSGYTFTDETYLTCMSKPETCNQELINYEELFTTYNLCGKNTDEIWLWGGPWFGYLEYTLNTYCGKTMFVMGFSYERGIAEALEDFGHRMEYIGQSRVARTSWGYSQSYQNNNNEWNRFTRIDVGCGNIHYPPGNPIGGKEYYFENPVVTNSFCNGYLTYPNGPFPEQTISCQIWGCTKSGYMRWWLSHIPHASGDSEQNSFLLYNNWWKYYIWFEQTANPRRVAPTLTPTQSVSPTPTISPTLSHTITPTIAPTRKPTIRSVSRTQSPTLTITTKPTKRPSDSLFTTSKKPSANVPALQLVKKDPQPVFSLISFIQRIFSNIFKHK